MPGNPSLPPPFGVPAGRPMSTPELLVAYVEGADAGTSPDAHIEDPVLMARDHALAIRLQPAVLVRDHVPPPVGELRDQLCQVLRDHGITLVEEDSVLACAVGIEVTGLRGEAWSLWARDADEARAMLAQRTVGEDVPNALAAYDARRKSEAEINAVLERLEREL